VVFDGRNLWNPEKMREQGYHYISIGRPAVAPIGMIGARAALGGAA
jgi:UDPglucose 6-dehydrogenase